MAGGGQQQVQERSGLNILAPVQDQLSTQSGMLRDNSLAFDKALQSAGQNYGTNFSGVSLNNNFAGPQFGNALDAMSQNLVAAGHGQIAGQRAAQNSQIAQQFQRNPALAAILQAQGNNQSQLAGNGLNFQASLAQRQREGQEYQMGQQAQALGNQSVLAQQGFNNNAQGQRNAALAQQAQLAGGRVANNQNMLSVLSNYANLTGQHYGNSQQGSTSMLDQFMPGKTWLDPAGMAVFGNGSSSTAGKVGMGAASFGFL